MTTAEQKRREENKAMMNEAYRKREILKKAPITIDEYREYKGKGLSDTKIMEKVGMHNAAFNEWKRAAGLIKTTVATSKAVEVTKSEAPVIESKQVEIEKSKGQARQPETANHWYEKYQELEKSYAKAIEELKGDYEHVAKSYSEESALEIKLLREELDSTQFKYKNVLEEREALYVQVAKLEEMKKNQPYDLQSQQAYKMLKNAYEVLKTEVETLRDAEQLSVALARRYVLLSEAVSS